jgi:F0F1-type ATP synthase assembly protein I
MMDVAQPLVLRNLTIGVLNVLMALVTLWRREPSWFLSAALGNLAVVVYACVTASLLSRLVVPVPLGVQP